MRAPASALVRESRGGWRRDVVRRAQHDRALIAGSFAQVTRDARLRVGQRGDRHPRLVLVDHAQALEGTDVDAIPTATADLFLNNGPRPLGAPNLLGSVAVRVEDSIVGAGATARAAVDADLRIDETEIFLHAVDSGDGTDCLARGAADALVVDEIRHSSAGSRRSLALAPSNTDAFGCACLDCGWPLDLRASRRRDGGRVHPDFSESAAALAGAEAQRRAG